MRGGWNMKKILQIGITNVYGGTEAYLMNQYSRLNHNQIRYEFMCIQSGVYMIPWAQKYKDMKVIFLPFNRRQTPFYTYFIFIKWMYYNAPKYDALVFNMNGLNVIFPALVYKIFGRGKLIIHSHNSGEIDGNFSPVMQGIRFINKKILNRIADIRLACSILAGRYLYDNMKFGVIRNGIDTERFRFDKSARLKLRNKYNLSDKMIIGHIGRFSYQKNQEFLIPLIAELKKINKNVVLFMIGDCKSDQSLFKRVSDLINKYGVTDNVILESPKENINEYYSMFDVFVLPSRFEGLPLVGVEAQSSGVCCFFSDSISKELAITPLAHYLPITHASLWASEILNTPISYERNIFAKMVKENGFDILDQVIKVEKILENI